MTYPSRATKRGLGFHPPYDQVKIQLVPPPYAGNGHWYAIAGHFNDLAQPSVTTVLGEVYPKPWLEPWREKVAFGKVAQMLKANLAPDPLLPTVRSVVIGETEIANLLAQARRLPDQLRDDAAAQGTAIHVLVDRHLRGEAVPESPALAAALRWLADHRLTVVGTEVRVWHPHYGCPGTIDLVARDQDGYLVIADWKSTKVLGDSYAWQLGAYAGSLKELTGEQVETA